MNEYCVDNVIDHSWLECLLYDHFTDSILLLLIQDSPVQFHPGPPDNEHADHEGDDKLDDPSSEHVVTVGHHLLHAEIATNQNTVF